MRTPALPGDLSPSCARWRRDWLSDSSERRTRGMERMGHTPEGECREFLGGCHLSPEAEGMGARCTLKSRHPNPKPAFRTLQGLDFGALTPKETGHQPQGSERA